VRNQSGNIFTDRQLVDLVLGGDPHAFGYFIKNTEGLVAQIVLKLIPNREDRKDIVQDIYLKAFHHLNRFRFQSKLSTWIGQIAYNTCISWLEKKKLVLATDPDTADHGPALDQESDGFVLRKELAGILQTEVGRLPPLYQTLVGLYHQEEMSYAEMAEITSLPVGTVKSYLFRARKILKDSLLSKYKKEAL
jgi:RNA polymerase sigma factor (sigma-70 family)